MPLEYFDTHSDTADIVSAIKRDGAAVVTEQISPEITDAVLAELRGLWDCSLTPSPALAAQRNHFRILAMHCDCRPEMPLLTGT
jgi:hypothetical protein